MPLNYKKRSVFAAFFFGSLFFFPLKLFSLTFKKSFSSIRKILIQDGYRLGDIVMMSRVFINLRLQFPNSEIHFITSAEACELLKRSGWVDNLIPFKAPWCFKTNLFNTIQSFIEMGKKLSKYNYDMAIDFQGDPRGCALLYISRIPIRYSMGDFGASAFCSRTYTIPKNIQHQIFRLEFLFEKVTGSKLPALITPVWPPQMQNIVPVNKMQKTIAIHPGASGLKRQWDKSNFSELINLCINNNFSVELIGGPADYDLLNSVKKRCKYMIQSTIPSFGDLELLLSNADCVICNDSFMGHVAWAFNKKAILLFGPGDPHQVAPFTGNIRIGWNDLILKPPFQKWTGAVDINKTTPLTVFNEINSLLEDKK